MITPPLIVLTPLIVCLALILDYALGEPKRYHPLVGFGNLAIIIERSLNKAQQNRLINGSLAVLFLCLVPAFFIACLAHVLAAYSWVLDVVILYLAIGFKSLLQHSKAVEASMLELNLEQARERVAMMVSRDSTKMSSTEIASATVESTLENGCDSTYGVLFCYLLGSCCAALFEASALAQSGIFLVVLYRLSNTLDAMWGYRTERYEQFGKSAAKLDDLLNFVPARISAVFYALVSNTSLAFQSWKKDAPKLASPNGGPVMSAGAGGLKLKLGGPTYYHGELHNKPYFGGDKRVSVEDIDRANKLVTRALFCWLVLIIFVSLLWGYT